ncbi:Fur family transcriptional regulator [Psychrosphaera aquimarina]|uniref:Fur family transcriptional regulator n=1 Tax=Psychrosphaera aquimarina TaxID=2044854 RepID=A0ABU3R498_9GAMM|nr:Fur family transcriptional regulator [Psychrosphaera aquimarina]MDU0114505.1 Fur family transcriptional regulator [Psychrosphaera aquimarina]
MVEDILLEDIIKHAHQICSENSVKLTTKREHVLSALIQASEAMSAYELAEQYRDIFEQSIPAMSVYRILDFLAEHSLVHKLTSANKYIACSHITCSHSHDVPQFLICEICNSVSEISVKKSVMSELTASVEKTGFKLSTSQLELKGICQSCQQ